MAGVNVTNPQKLPKTNVPCDSSCDTLMNPNCPMAISAEYTVKSYIPRTVISSMFCVFISVKCGHHLVLNVFLWHYWISWMRDGITSNCLPLNQTVCVSLISCFWITWRHSVGAVRLCVLGYKSKICFKR